MGDRLRVAVTRRIPSVGLEKLREKFEVVLHDSDKAPGRETLERLMSGADGAVTLLSDAIDGELLDACPRLRIVANHAVGYENVDVEAATARGIVVTNTPGVLTDATADLTMALMLAAARRIVEADRFMRAGRYEGWDPRMLRGMDLAGRTLGVFGFGRIGQAMARRAAAFGMRIIYTDTAASPEIEGELGARRVEFEELLRESDVLTVHSPYLPELHKRFGAAEFAAMKPGALFVNTARGKLMDEGALAAALKAKEIAAAGLDVYEDEPAFRPELAAMDNVVLLPHIGSATWGTRNAMAELAARNVIEVLEGRAALTAVNAVG